MFYPASEEMKIATNFLSVAAVVSDLQSLELALAQESFKLLQLGNAWELRRPLQQKAAGAGRKIRHSMNTRQPH